MKHLQTALRTMKQTATLTVVAFASQAWAQGPPDPEPTDAHKILADDAGTWDAAVKMYFRGPTGPATESTGIETNELVSGGLFARRTFKYKVRNKDFEGHGLFGYDPRSKEYTGTWVDNLTAVPTQLKGKFDAESKTLTMLGAVVDASGKEIKQKQVTTFVDDATKTFEIFIIVDASGKTHDVKIMEMTAKRRS
jgi:hypothetical protein